MPRPFAVAGFSMFFVMLVLCCTGIGPCLYIGIALFVLFAVSLIVPVSRKQRVLPAALAAGVVSCALFAVNYYVQYKPALDLAGGSYDIVAELKDDGENDVGRWYYEAEIQSVNGCEVSCKVRLSLRDRLDADAYDKVSGVFTFYEKQNRNSSLFKVNSSECVVGAYPSLYKTDTVTVIKVNEKDKPSDYYIQLLRQKLRSNLLACVPGDNGAVACALLLGKTSEFPDSLRAKFNSAGVAHIICVSGLHLSIWALFILKILRKAGLKKRKASAGAIAATVFYMALTGFSYSVVRAGVMMITVLAANILSRRSDSLNSLGFAAVVIFTVSPFSACDASVQLSFLATLGLLVLMPYFSKKLEERLAVIGGKKADIIRYFSLIIITAVCASAFTLPVSILDFGEVNFMSFAGNLLIIPAVSVCMILSGITAVLPMIKLIAVLRYPAGYLCLLCTKYINGVVTFLSRFSFVTFYPQLKLAYLWLGGAFLIMSVAVYYAFLKINVIKLTSILLSASFVSMLIISWAFYSDITDITVIDSGNASAVLVTKGKYSALIGCGKGGFTSSTDIAEELESRHISSLNLLLVPQPGSSESGCTVDILSEFGTDVLACSSMPEWSYLTSGDADIDEYGDRFVMQVCSGCKVTAVNDESGCWSVISVAGLDIFIPYTDNAVCYGYHPDFIVCSGELVPCYDFTDCSAAVIYGDGNTAALQNEIAGSGTLCAATAGQGNVVISVSETGRYKLYRK